MQASDGRREAETVGVEPAHADRERRERGWHVPSAAAFVVHGHQAAAPRRTTRALVLTATAVTVGVGAHVLAGGLVSMTGIVAAFPPPVGPGVRFGGDTNADRAAAASRSQRSPSGT
jgi:hypothetical protein